MSNQLDTEVHVFVFDLMECYDATSKPRVKQSLLSAINEKLAEYFDPEAVYERHQLVPMRRELVFSLLVNPNDENAEPNVVRTINIKTGKYTVR